MTEPTLKPGPSLTITDSSWLSFEPARTLTPLNKTLLTRVIHAQLRGETPLPYRLGLTKADYHQLLDDLNDQALIEYDRRWQMSTNENRKARAKLIDQLMTPRLEERNALLNWLFQYIASDRLHGFAIATMVATACLSPTHLWKSLGLHSRDQLHKWLSHNFPTLVAGNQNNMRWKRYFYLLLCQSEGDYVCRAPSCDECTSYQQCFVA